MTVKEIAKEANVKVWKVYHIAKQLNRLPTTQEILNWRKRGRPPKNWKSVEQYKNAFDDIFAESNTLLEKITIKKEN